MNITQVIDSRPMHSSRQRVNRNSWIPDLMVMHTTSHSTRSAVNTLKNAGSGNNVGSYRFIIAGSDVNATQSHKHPAGVRDGAVIRCVPVINTAFANGTGTGNLSPAHS